jgi:uncharacterized membrane protein
MGFSGAVVGAVIGAMLYQLPGALVGAVAGGAAGWLVVHIGARLEALEKRVRALELALTGGVQVALPPTAAAIPTPPEPEPVPETRWRAQPQAEPLPIPQQQPEPQPEPQATAPVFRAEPRGPNFWERLFTENLLVKAGIVILFFGVAFLLKYMYERVHVPIELRLAAIAAGGIALLAIGWRLRSSRPGYALAMQGGGVGVLYLVIFAAFRMFHLLPPTLAFVLLVGVAVFSAALAIIQNSLALAAIGVSGGFLAPVLASTGQGSHVMLFSYYAVLNAGIVAIAWVKAWRVLNLLGFAFTFVIGWLWGAKAYRPEYFSSTEPFLLGFLAMYVAIPLLFARRRVVELKDYVDGTLVFGVPIAAFGLQVAMVRGIEYGAAYSAFGLGVFYLLLALVLFRRTGSGMRLLVECFIALSLAFGTLAIPLAFDGRMTSAAWALEGAAVAWVAVRQGRLLARAFGYLLQFAAGIAFLLDAGRGYGSTPVLNSAYAGTVFIALAAFFCAAYIERNRARLLAEEYTLSFVLLGWGALWWFGGGTLEIVRHVTWAYRTQSVLLFFTASALGFSLLSAPLRWPTARWLWLALYPAMAMQLVLEVARGAHPFAHLGALAWPAAFFAHFWLLSRHAADHRKLGAGLHTAGVWMIAILGAREVGWLIDYAVEGKRVWPSIAWALVPAAVLAALSARRVQARWPVRDYAPDYIVNGGAPVAVFLALWTLYANFTSSGDPYPLVFVPVLNPLDLAIGAVFVVVAVWLRAAREHGLEPWLRTARSGLIAAAGAGAFVWVNGTLLRTLHHWAGLPFALEPMLSSRLVQASFSILWTLLAVTSMVLATRRALRPLWVIGAALMGIVVVKLFLIDLSGIGTVERIVSFIGVGLLMLLVGYLSPVPPREVAHAS